jgi:hypothetical protein
MASSGSSIDIVEVSSEAWALQGCPAGGCQEAELHRRC